MPHRYDNTIRDRNLVVAMGTPLIAFVQLLKLVIPHISKAAKLRKATHSEHLSEHLSELRSSTESLHVVSLVDNISKMPPHLNLEQQGLSLIHI